MLYLIAVVGISTSIMAACALGAPWYHRQLTFAFGQLEKVIFSCKLKYKCTGNPEHFTVKLEPLGSL